MRFLHPTEITAISAAHRVISEQIQKVTLLLFDPLYLFHAVVADNHDIARLQLTRATTNDELARHKGRHHAATLDLANYELLTPS